MPSPVLMYPFCLNACGNVVHNSPGLPAESTPDWRKDVLKFQVLVWSGLLPVKKELREGPHTACCT